MTTKFADHFLGPDTHPNRPSAAGVPVGTRYSCSTHGLIYKSDGVSWTVWAALLPAGGTSGQALTKNSNTDYDAGWSTPSAGASSSVGADLPGSWYGWKSAVAKMSTVAVKALHIGDSMTEGTGVTALTDVWTHRLGVKVRDAYASIAANAADPIGYVPAFSTSSTRTSPWTISGSYDTTPNFGLRKSAATWLKAAGATITGTVTGTSIDVWYATGSATGAFTVSVDGGAAVSVGGSSGAVIPSNVTRVSLGAAGSHTVTIARGSADCYIEGITVYNGNENAGYVAFNAGRHGWTSTNWATNDQVATDWKTSLTKVNPDLVTILLGSNDYSGGVTPATYAANLETLIGWIRDSAATWPAIVLMVPWKTSTAAASKAFEHFEYRVPQVAHRLGCGYLDLRKVMPDIGTADGNASGYYADATHLTAAGNEKVAIEVANLLLANAA